MQEPTVERGTSLLEPGQDTGPLQQKKDTRVFLSKGMTISIDTGRFVIQSVGKGAVCMRPLPGTKVVPLTPAQYREGVKRMKAQ